MVTVLTLASLGILLLYTAGICIRAGKIPNSLSASVFDLPIGYRWQWTVVIASVVFIIVGPLMDCTPDRWRFLCWLACAGLLFVAGCPLEQKKTGMSYKVHMVSAIVCAVSANILMAVCEPWLLLIWLGWVGLFVCNTRGSNQNWNTWCTKVFWAELVCFTETYAYCLIN